MSFPENYCRNQKLRRSSPARATVIGVCRAGKASRRMREINRRGGSGTFPKCSDRHRGKAKIRLKSDPRPDLDHLDDFSFRRILFFPRILVLTRYSLFSCLLSLLMGGVKNHEVFSDCFCCGDCRSAFRLRIDHQGNVAIDRDHDTAHNGRAMHPVKQRRQLARHVARRGHG